MICFCSLRIGSNIAFCASTVSPAKNTPRTSNKATPRAYGGIGSAGLPTASGRLCSMMLTDEAMALSSRTTASALRGSGGGVSVPREANCSRRTASIEVNKSVHAPDLRKTSKLPSWVYMCTKTDSTLPSRLSFALVTYSSKPSRTSWCITPAVSSTKITPMEKNAKKNFFCKEKGMFWQRYS